jgi:hypothetical protein
MKIHLIIALFLTLILNIIGLSNIDIQFYGFFILIGVYSIIATFKIALPKLLFHTLLLVVFSTLVRIIIGIVFNYTTVSDSGEVVPIWATIMAGIVTIILSEIITSLVVLFLILTKMKK